MHFCRQPPPRPRLRHSSPAPSWGRGPCVAISGEQPYPGCSRWEALSGSSPGSPHAVDRGDIATGGGADGEGELVPPPLSLTLQAPYSLSALSRPAFSRQATRTLSAGPLLSHPVLSQGIPIRSLPAPPPRLRLRRDTPALLPAAPTPPAPAALLPRPLPGAGSVRGDIRGAAVSGMEPVGNRIRFFSRISPCCGPCGYRHGGRRLAGRGNLFPLPCLPHSNHLTSRRQPPTPPAPP